MCAKKRILLSTKVSGSSRGAIPPNPGSIQPLVTKIVEDSKYDPKLEPVANDFREKIKAVRFGA